MRQINIFILFLMAGMMLSSCHDDQSGANFEPLDYYVKVKASIYSVDFDRHGASLTSGSDAITLTISPENEGLDVWVEDSWCHVEHTRTGDVAQLKITAEANAGERRTTKVHAMAGKGADRSGAIINVTQETAFIVPAVSANSDVVIFDKYGGQETLTVTTNLLSWDYELTDVPGGSGGTSWCTVVRDGDKLMLTAPDAGSIDLREVNLVITATEDEHTATTTIRVTQDKNRKMVAGIELILVEGGTFQMGANSGDVGYVGTLATTNAPKHAVTLSDYYIGKFEVTQKQYYDIMGTNPSQYPWGTYTGPDNDRYDPTRPETAMYGDYPVENITWVMAKAFCDKLNEQYSDLGTFSVPTEAQWEYAARGGKHINEANRVRYSGSDNVASVGNTGAGSGTQITSRPKPVGQYQPNELGIFDMTGNVMEHVYDFFAAYPSGAVTDPTGPSSANTVGGTTGATFHHIFRGGSFWHTPYTVFQRAGNANVNYTGTGLMGMRVVFKRNP